MCFESLLLADAVHIAEQSKVDAARIKQKASNERKAAETTLAQFSASLANKRALDAAGETVNDIAANYTRMRDAATVGTLQGRIAAAEEIGRASAQAGAAGVGGASVDAFNNTVRLQHAIRERSMEDQLKAQGHAITAQAANTIKASVATLDNNVYRANLDYTQYLDHKKPSAFEQIVNVGLTAAATVFGGPQAGAAVSGMFEARQSFRNGDFAGGSQALQGSFSNGMGAMRANHLMGGNKGTVKASPAAQPAIPLFGNAEDGFTDSPSFFRSSGPSYGSIIIK